MQTQPQNSHQLWISLNDSCWSIVTIMLSSIFFPIRQKTQSLLLIICIRHMGQFIFLLLYELFTTIFLKYSNYSKTIFCSEWWIACSQNEDCEYILKIKLQFCSNFHRHKSIEKKNLLASVRRRQNNWSNWDTPGILWNTKDFQGLSSPELKV